MLRLDLPDGEHQARLRKSSRRRTLEVQVSDAGEVRVNAPLRASHSDIGAFLLRHVDWIADRLHQARDLAMRWQNGDRLPYLGGELSLVLLNGEGRPRVRLDARQLCCHAPSERVAEVVTRWYRDQARQWLGARLAWHCARLGRPLPPLRLSNARTRWGSLSVRGVVGLNWRLIKTSEAEIDYVICHELAHFRLRRHSAAFWGEVESLCPGHEAARRRLRLNQADYFRF